MFIYLVIVNLTIVVFMRIQSSEYTHREKQLTDEVVLQEEADHPESHANLKKLVYIDHI